MRIPRPRLNYANVIATIALFVALGGAAIAAGLPKNSVGTKQLKRGAVNAAKLKRGAVTPGKIAPRAVVAGKLGANAVLPGNLGNGIISTVKLSDGAVIASKIKNGVITTNKLTNGAVTTAKLGDGSVTAGKLADNIAPLLGTLKSGQTLRGVFDLGSTADAVAELNHSAVSLQFPLLNAPAVTVLKKGETSANCAGLGGGGQTPQATAGNLCVYVTESKNLDATTPLVVENNTRLGFGLVAKAEAAGEYYAYGQWAVTAP
jgi:trimeric autotransporter adhesin